MSDKYILRSGAIDAIKRNAGTLYTREAEFLLQKVIFLLKHAPAADVAEVVHGRWIWNEEGEIGWEQFYRCSNCGNKEYWESNFCPNCGARMDGGNDDAVY